ncbi:DUF2721 domain-containing protein [bacterium]|nr:DUF2721 domain-containing protein [bacterium]
MTRERHSLEVHRICWQSTLHGPHQQILLAILHRSSRVTSLAPHTQNLSFDCSLIMRLDTGAEALQLATSPVILISACGLLLLSMTNRLGRAIDRAHVLIREQNDRNIEQIAIIVKRARYIRTAILFTTICILLNSILVLALFISVHLAVNIAGLVVLLFSFGLISLTTALMSFMKDIFSALRALDIEIQHASPPLADAVGQT